MVTSTAYKLAKTLYLRTPVPVHPIALPKQLASKRKLSRSDGTLRLHLGCGQRKLPGFVNIDQNFSRATDYVGDISELPCPPDSVERIETYHVIEHIPHQLAEATVKHWWSVLRPGGTLVIECPDFDQDVRDYLEGNEDRLMSIFGLQRFPGDTHLFGYNGERLERLLRQAGFAKVSHEVPQDYHAADEPCIRVEAVK